MRRFNRSALRDVDHASELRLEFQADFSRCVVGEPREGMARMRRLLFSKDDRTLVRGVVANATSASPACLPSGLCCRRAWHAAATKLRPCAYTKKRLADHTPDGPDPVRSMRLRGRRLPEGPVQPAGAELRPYCIRPLSARIRIYARDTQPIRSSHVIPPNLTNSAAHARSMRTLSVRFPQSHVLEVVPIQNRLFRHTRYKKSEYTVLEMRISRF